MLKKIAVFIVLASFFEAFGQEVALLKYDGGGDWYANPTSLKNLVLSYNESQGARIRLFEKELTPNEILIQGPTFLHATGHGRIYFTKEQATVIRTFLERGGFLHIDDNYGMKDFALEAMREVFPDLTPMDVPSSHPIYSTPYPITGGLPKIHEHDGESPRAMGYFLNGELVALLTLESDLGDGWEDTEVHNDSEEKRQSALKMGVNLLHWSIVRNSSNQ
jgi:hypothetical protein